MSQEVGFGSALPSRCLQPRHDGEGVRLALLLRLRIGPSSVKDKGGFIFAQQRYGSISDASHKQRQSVSAQNWTGSSGSNLDMRWMIEGSYLPSASQLLSAHTE